jgi:hypothetical protein
LSEPVGATLSERGLAVLTHNEQRQISEKRDSEFVAKLWWFVSQIFENRAQHFNLYRNFEKTVVIVCKLKRLYGVNKLFPETVVSTNRYTEVPFLGGKTTERDAKCLLFLMPKIKKD